LACVEAGMLIEFYGKECEHCQAMISLVEKLEKETGVALEKYEVWHDSENHEKMVRYDKEFCGGVPFFINTDSNDFICGEASYSELKKWAGK